MTKVGPEVDDEIAPIVEFLFDEGCCTVIPFASCQGTVGRNNSLTPDSHSASAYVSVIVRSLKRYKYILKILFNNIFNEITIRKGNHTSPNYIYFHSKDDCNKDGSYFLFNERTFYWDNKYNNKIIENINTFKLNKVKYEM